MKVTSGQSRERAKLVLVLDSTEVYSIDDAAEALGFSRATIFRKIAKCEIHTLKLNNRTLIPASEIDRLIHLRTLADKAKEAEAARLERLRSRR